MNSDDVIVRLSLQGDGEKAAQMARYHKADRRYLGVANPVLNDLARDLRRDLPLEVRIDLARDLWTTDIHEIRVLAAKLFTQARIRPDEAVWSLIQSWLPDCDAWAIADHVCMAGQKRLVAEPARLDTVEDWTRSDHMWTRRAALVITLPWTKQNHPKPAELAQRDRILGWAATYVTDRDWFIQKAVAWWLRDLSKHDAPRVQAFLVEHGATMKPFARKVAAKYLPAP
ncbi:DNA alkylation repair protein [Sedimentitalea todarodis]|uniref:DNA alkylation repair protein n=1 Tax=Sedimentitalea todarodis TaxID=1631240 RepID=A0ABU3V9C1_9RHOB|nr:DNA alkylation repair protein [Sedimentitalea todarodis]MDU9002635.1 DNA alkylation repair protein [Sedimentitalea todarodis]